MTSNAGEEYNLKGQGLPGDGVAEGEQRIMEGLTKVAISRNR